ncbi:type II toxin-antitoxin system HipA family toxin [Poseidonibacter ostreae]|jgi:serine/threonine-protein kinase HipA|uniref:Type II toxin-antitoxin system HipA family toxin n=1 Tax=Poseidonibacter ostreae TaxID=2654171 RepID=A0A6L4WT96_9BACT|nr:type II toxin-antitoxin system HipA family toxin [Poseidonibacter ostreae]KAB7887058.1 type II toxin-antitoxin system HipA family toxin [Poseidonibacter ostreae]KAB7889218.1 type II toxin-antitoxin system HipA family toxin [Poseidonibacter ostreae]KAB7891581.1 type II toxin-antitoxin system HipA family toxin [Poseidonibacter ostreae]MAC84091.1 phosphatidylinositol kinase [Arcobacter sp.]|tara:strand:+ start:3273 stop:4487 length:1215 start_codon:yes stop_codon:yes gene_type:complete
MKDIEVKIDNKKIGQLFFEKNKNQYGFNYTLNYKPISLIMPYKNSTYLWKYKLHPIFDMNIPEGYLFEIFKKYLTKEYGYIDDFLIFSYICTNIQSRLSYKSFIDKKEFFTLDMDDVLENDSEDNFTKIVSAFLDKNAISGVQPKTLAILKDKESLSSKEYIIKTWGDEYPQLALNEYFCLKAIEKAGVIIPNLKLSKNNKFLLVERFNYEKETDSFLGFEELITLLGKNKDEKYSGSYEQIAKVIYSVTTNKIESMMSLYKLIIMNYLLRNGDAHLKNFGILYDKEISNIWFSPAYDVVNTQVYFYKDKPALTMHGKKLWLGKKELVKFGINDCYLSKEVANSVYDECILVLINSIDELKEYIKTNSDFEDIGRKMIDTWKLSLSEKTSKELAVEVIRNWTKN